MINRRQALSAMATLSLSNSVVAAVRIEGSSDLDDHTTILAEAIAEAATNGSGVVWLAAGRYNVTSLTLRSGVVLCGAGRRATTIRAMQSQQTSLINLAEGPVVNAGLRDLTIEGGDNPEQWAFHLVASPAPSGKAHGGLWWSSFEEVSIRNFPRGIWLQGGNENYMLPHQFLSLSNMSIELGGNIIGPALRITGQVNQTKISQFYVDAVGEMPNSAVEIVGHEGSPTSPKMIHFDVATVQNATLALYIKGAQNIKFSSCWFEELQATAQVEKNSLKIQFDNCRFANAGRTGPSIHFADGSSGTIGQSIFAGDNKVCHRVDSSAVSVLENDYIWGSSSSS